MNIKLIAFDLDGTLLDDHKRVTPHTMDVLKRAADAGIILVPATGRIRSAVPDFIRELPFVHYLITINGGVVWDLIKEKEVYRKVFEPADGLKVWDFISGYDSMNDIYADGCGWMEPGNPAMFPEYVYYPEMIKLIQSTRKIIPDVREHIRNGNGVEKFNLYFADRELQDRAKKEISDRFPFVKATNSVINNIELNPVGADKGHGLKALCDYLDIPVSEAAAFGDGDNDTPMLVTAGVGVAMENAVASVKEAVRYSTLTNEQEGVADFIERYILSGEPLPEDSQ